MTSLVKHCLGIILWTFLAVKRSSSVAAPSSQLINHGTTTNMTCNVPCPVEWCFKSATLNTADSSEVYNGIRMGKHYINDSNYIVHISVINGFNISTLTIWNTSYNHAGMYTCSNHDQKEIIEIIVYESTCNITLYDESERVTRVTCSITSMQGSQLLQWTPSENNVTSNATKTYVSNTLTSELTVQRNAHIPDSQSYNETYQCFTNNTQSDLNSTVYDNKHLCDIPVLWPAIFGNSVDNKYCENVTDAVANNTTYNYLKATTVMTSMNMSTLIIALLAVTGSMAAVLIVVIIRLCMFNRRLAQEKRKVQTLEEVVLREMTKKEVQSRGSRYFHSIISSVSPIIRTSKLHETSSNSMYAEIGESDLCRITNENKTTDQLNNHGCTSEISESILKINNINEKPVTYSIVDKKRAHGAQVVQCKEDMESSIMYSVINQKPLSSSVEVQNRLMDNHSPVIYSEVNKNRLTSVPSIQNQMKTQFFPAFFDENKIDNGCANNDQCSSISPKSIRISSDSAGYASME